MEKYKLKYIFFKLVNRSSRVGLKIHQPKPDPAQGFLKGLKSQL